MPFLMLRNDITKVHADAIVNPANPWLRQGSGTSRGIYLAAGEEQLTAACGAIGRCEPGKAVCTPGFALPAKYIFHAVCPRWHGGTMQEEQKLSSTYGSALQLALEYQCTSIAFPLLSTGNYAYPKEQAFRVAMEVITRFLLEHEMMVYLVLYDRESVAVGQKFAASLDQYIDDHYAIHNDEGWGWGACLRAAHGELQGKVRPRLPEGESPQSLEQMLSGWQKETFSEQLLRLIDERGLKDPDVYRGANLTRQHFSKIRSNMDHRPTKRTALALAVSLQLTVPETEVLLQSAGFAFSNCSKQDIIVRYCMEHKIYNINRVNALLYQNDQEQLGF